MFNVLDHHSDELLFGFREFIGVREDAVHLVAFGFYDSELAIDILFGDGLGF